MSSMFDVGHNKAACRKFYAAIAKASGGCFALKILVKSVGSMWGAVFVDLAERHFIIRPEWRKPSRLVIDGDWPTGTGNSHHHMDINVSITVAATRSPEAISRDVSRRFLPDFDSAWETVTNRVTAHNAYTSDLEELVNATRNRIAGAELSRSSEMLRTPFPYHEVQCHGEGTLSISLRYADRELGEAVIDLVEEWRKREYDKEGSA